MQPVASDSPGVQRSLEDLRECIAVDAGQSSLPLGLRATIFAVVGQYDAALSDLDQAVRIEKTSSLFVQRALLRERRDQFSEALADLDAAISLDAANQNAWINRARLWTRYGDIDRAVADYDQAEAVGGAQSWDALSGRAKLSLRLGEPVRAFADLTKAAGVAPLPTLSAQLYVRAGNVARDYLKQSDKTEASYQRAFEVLPSYPDAFIQRGIHPAGPGCA